jgi:hypothetical protein
MKIKWNNDTLRRVISDDGTVLNIGGLKLVMQGVILL